MHRLPSPSSTPPSATPPSAPIVVVCRCARRPPAPIAAI
uniref:Predicted protein n=1 Tax=Hordeum vulgare subsp. vulgare TaxID=112509 RepID=F2DX98_HORVV|nr:predicted protein [Hordeum vulgare subsp. vulgare]